MKKYKPFQLFWSFFKIGVFTFGGGYAMIALIEKETVGRAAGVSRSVDPRPNLSGPFGPEYRRVRRIQGGRVSGRLEFGAGCGRSFVYDHSDHCALLLGVSAQSCGRGGFHGNAPCCRGLGAGADFRLGQRLAGLATRVCGRGVGRDVVRRILSGVVDCRGGDRRIVLCLLR